MKKWYIKLYRIKFLIDGKIDGEIKEYRRGSIKTMNFVSYRRYARWLRTQDVPMAWIDAFTTDSDYKGMMLGVQIMKRLLSVVARTFDDSGAEDDWISFGEGASQMLSVRTVLNPTFPMRQEYMEKKKELSEEDEPISCEQIADLMDYADISSSSPAINALKGCLDQKRKFDPSRHTTIGEFRDFHRRLIPRI